MKNEVLQKAIAECGCKVVLQNEEYVDGNVSNGSGGNYQNGGPITIAAKNPVHAQYETLLHEIGHHLCWLKKCRCFKNQNDRSRVKREVHAQIYGMKQLLKERNRKALRHTLKKLQVAWPDWPIYKQAAKKLTKTRLWRRCKKFIEQPK